MRRDARFEVGVGPRQAFVLGAMVASVAASMEFDDNTVADIRLIAEELVRLLFRENSPDTVECAVSVDDYRAKVTLSTTAEAPDPQGYRWRALGAIADTLSVSDDTTNGRTEIHFSRGRVEGTPVSEPRTGGADTVAGTQFSITG